MKESRYSKFIKNRILLFCVLLLIVCISFGVSYSNFVINGTEQRAVEMFAGGLKYTMSLNDTAANSILVEPGTTTATIDVTSSSSVPYKYILTNSINENIEVISFSEDASGTIEPNESKSIEVEITNNSENNINTSFELASGYTTNEISDIEFKSGFTSITIIGSTNSYLDKTKFYNFVTNNSPTEIYFTITGHSTGTDISNDPTEPIYAWMEEDKMYVSAREPNKKVSAPVDSSYLFSGFSYTKLKDVKKIDAQYLNTKNVTNMSYMFHRTGENATTFELDLSNWDTSNVTNMFGMFYFAGTSATTFELDLSKWDTSNVTNMSSMFSYAGTSAPTFELDLSNWNTSKVTDMSSMFFSAGQNSTTWSIGDLSKWDTSNVTNMYTMFFNSGTSATTWSVGNISNWDVSNVTNMGSLFSQSGKNATTWFIGDLSNWNTSQVTDMSDMFRYAGYNATVWSIGDLSNWNTSNVTDMSSMFYCAGHNATTFKLNLGSWDTSKVINMSQMFYWSGENATTFNLDLNAWDTSEVTNMSSMFSRSGAYATTFKILIPERSNDTTNNTVSNLYGLSTSATPPAGRTFTLLSTTTAYLDKTKFRSFVESNSPTEIYFTITGHSTGTDISNDPTEPIYAWMEESKMYVSAKDANKKVSAPVDSSYLFSGSICEKFKDVKKVDVEYLNTKNVTNMSYMFEDTGYNATTFELNLSKWNTSSVIDMSYMFYMGGYNATTWSIGDLSNWDTSKVTNMSSMFSSAGTHATTWSIGDLSNWDTSNVTLMSDMFNYAGYKATTFKLDLSTWDTSNVRNMSHMFYCAGAYATTFELDLGKWDTSKVTDMLGMFSYAGHNASTFKILIPERSNGTTNNTVYDLYGLSTSATLLSRRRFTLVN